MSSNNTFAIACKYHALGRCVIPSGGGPEGKVALIKWKKWQDERPDDTQLKRWQNELCPSIWAMPTGPVSGLFAVDCDTQEAHAIMKAAGLQPHIKTRKGFHYYVHWPSWMVTNSSRLLPGIDIRGQGGYVNFCGANSKASYEVLTWPTDDSLYTVEQLPGGLQNILEPKPKILADRILQEALDQAQPGNRNDTGLHLACQLRDNGLSQAEAESVMLRYATQVGNTGSEPYTERESTATLEQAYSRPAREAWQVPISVTANRSFNLTDLGNAERLVSQFGDRLKYCYGRKQWLFWTEKVWEWDSGDKIKQLAKLAVRNIYHEAGNEPDNNRRRDLASHAKSSESDHRINSLISLAQSEPGIPVKLNKLDTKPWLLNCLNGTLDLHTGQLHPHHKEDLLTLIVPVEYHPDAECPRWLTFLDQVTGGDTELQDYLQRAVGYSLTGNIKNQVVFFLYGLGNNGKSTFTMAIRKLLAGYGERLDADALMVKDRKTGGGPKESIANLQGKRYVVGSEVQDGRKLDVSLIKDMTGGETITARRLYEHDIEFAPTQKLWLFGNHKPVISDTTSSIWRRVKLIPFMVTIPDKEIDPDLPSKLEMELPGILAWAVKGCLYWQRNGLKEPNIVTTATTNYRQDQDILGDFIEECCILEAKASMPKAGLKAKYEAWCNDNNIDTVGQRTFKANLIEKGITDSRTGKTRYWHGIQLRPDTDSDISGGTGDNTLPHLATEVTRMTENTVKPLYKENQKKFTENSVTPVTLVTENNLSPSPTQPCPNCGCNNYWLTDWNEWLCSRCHPKPKGGDKQ